MVETITPAQAYEWLKNGEAILIDVREPDEFKDCHIPYAASMPLKKIETLLSHIPIPSSQKIIFQCLKGKRGEQACLLISGKNKISNTIYNIDGGIDNWANAGLPIVKSGAGLSIFRQVQIIIGSFITILVVLGFMGLWFAFALAGLIATALAIAGITGWCGLAILLSYMPWNRS